MSSLEFRGKSTFNAMLIERDLRYAAEATTQKMATHMIDYMREKFEEPKSGQVYFLKLLNRTYTASAPGEFPAVKYGILSNSLKHEPYTEGAAGEVGVVMGAAPYSGSFMGVIPHNPFYADELEWIRPYFTLTMYLTQVNRPRTAAADFVTAFNKIGGRRR